MCASASSTSVERGAKIGKQPHEIGQLVIRIQAARVWQNPDTCVVNSFGLLPNLRFRFREREAIRAYSEDRHNLRMIALYFRGQCPATCNEIFFGQLSG